MKLHLGCGHNYMEGWVNVDGPKNELCYDDLKADVHARIEDLEYPDTSVDEILMNAVFEHFPRHVAIMQLRKFYKWLKPGGKLTILVPDFWGTVEMLRKSESPKEQQFWFRHLFGPQDTIQFGTHYDAFSVDKLEWMFSIVGFNKYEYEIIKRWPSVRFTGIKDHQIKSEADAERDVIDYMANYEAKNESGIAFKAWVNAMGLKTEKPKTPTFKTHEMYKRSSLIRQIISKLKRTIYITTVGTQNQATREQWLEKTLKQIPAGSRILDAGAGEQQYRRFCNHLNYMAQDFGQYDGKGNDAGLQMENWNQSNLDIISDITAIPESDASFDAIMCVEVFEHLPEPIKAIQEFARLLKPGGHLILTAPFCSLTHFAPYHYYTGYNRYFYEAHLPANGFKILDLQENGNYFEYLAQEVRRIPSMAERYAQGHPSFLESIAMKLCLSMLGRFSKRDRGSSEMLHFGCHIHALKKEKT